MIAKKIPHMTITRLGMSLLTYWMTGCGSPLTEPSENKIYGGKQTNPGSWRSAVALTESNKIICSGSAVHPKLIITAAHCVKGTNRKRLGVYVGDGNEGGRVSAQYKISKTNHSPKYGGSSNDIGYLVLDKALNFPANAYIPILVKEDEKAAVLKAGNQVRLVGFGERDKGGYGLKYEVDARITHITSNEVVIGGGGKDSCYGDSGGPAFGYLKNGEWRVFGVVSRGNNCGSGGMWGLIHSNICWIQKDSGIDLGFNCR